MNGLNALCCVGAFLFSSPLPRRGDLNGMQVTMSELESDSTSWNTSSTRVFCLTVGGGGMWIYLQLDWSMGVPPSLLSVGLLFLFLTRHVCGQGKKKVLVYNAFDITIANNTDRQFLFKSRKEQDRLSLHTDLVYVLMV